MKPYKIQKIFIESSVSENPFAKKLRRNYKNTPSETISNPKEIIASFRGESNSIDKGKRHILLERNKGKFLKKCPATKNYICCGLNILHLGLGCNLDCTYCILQSYLNNPLLSIFTNIDEALKELREALGKMPHRFSRICTGEFMDSLAFDDSCEWSALLVPFFATKNNATLELKTKTTNINNLKRLKHNKRTIISWSLNSKTVQGKEERGSPSIEKRLEAAKKCVEWGYPVGFHFDPIILHKGWQTEYTQTIDKIFKKIPADSIVWISMGCFRFMPGLKTIINKRFPESRIPYGEFVRGLDNKMRYFKPLRIRAYKTLYERIRQHSKDGTVYLCMESDEVWRKSFGWSPGNTVGLRKLLDETARNTVTRVS